MVNAAQWQLLVNEINTTVYKVSFADALSKGKIQRKCQNLGDIIHWRPPLQIRGGACPPSPKVYASDSNFNDFPENQLTKVRAV